MEVLVSGLNRTRIKHFFNVIVSKGATVNMQKIQAKEDGNWYEIAMRNNVRALRGHPEQGLQTGLQMNIYTSTPSILQICTLAHAMPETTVGLLMYFT